MHHILPWIQDSHGKLSHYLIFLACTLCAALLPILLAMWLASR